MLKAGRFFFLLFLVAVGVVTQVNPATASLPGKNGRIIVARGLANPTGMATFNLIKPQAFVTGPNGGSGSVLSNSPEDVNDPVFTPDGKTIVFAGSTDGNIYSMPSSNLGAVPKKLTTDGANGYPSVAPDGKSIVFAHFTVGPDIPKGPNSMSVIKVMPIGGGPAKALTGTSVGDSITGTDISPDGKKIVYAGTEDVFVANIDGSNAKPIGLGFDPSFSPNGQRIVFESGLTEGASGIATMTTIGTNKDQITPDTNGLTGGTDSHPFWSPDGTRIGFTRSNGSTFDLMTIGVDGTNLKTLERVGAYDFRMGDWSRSAPFEIRGLNRGKTLKVMLYGPGKVSLGGAGIRKTSKTVTKNGLVRITVLKKAGLKAKIKRNGKAKVFLKVKFQPKGALASTITVPVHFIDI